MTRYKDFCSLYCKCSTALFQMLSLQASLSVTRKIEVLCNSKCKLSSSWRPLSEMGGQFYQALGDLNF